MSDLLKNIYENYTSDKLEIENLQDEIKKKRELAYLKYREYLSNLDLNNLEIEDLKSLKDIFFSMGGCCEEYLSLSNMIELKKPYTFKIINNMNYLSLKQKALLDKALERYQANQLIRTNGIWFGLKLTKEQEERVIADLYENGYLLNYYKISCKCCICGHIYLSDDEINELKENELVIKKINNHEKGAEIIPEEELDVLYDKFYDITENSTHGVYQCESGECIIYCYDCDGETIYQSIEDMKKASSKKYKVVHKDMLKEINDKL